MMFVASPSLGRRFAEVGHGDISVARVGYEPHTAMPVHAHERASLTLVLAGRFEEHVGGAVYGLSSLSVIYKPAGLPHATRIGQRAASSLNLSLPRSAVRQLDESRAAFFGGGPLAAALLMVLRVLAGASTRSLGEHLDACLYHLSEAMCRATPIPDPVIERASAMMLRGSSVDVAASRVGVDPATLWRRFRRATDVPPSVWRRRARVRAAAARLADTSTGIASIAAAAGFADQAHLTRCFRRETGITPRAYRALASALPRR